MELSVKHKNMKQRDTVQLNLLHGVKNEKKCYFGKQSTASSSY